MKIQILLPFIFLSIIFLSCGEETAKKLDLKKKSRGAYGEIVLVIDTALWNDTLGKELKKCFRKPFPGLPQGEAQFNLRVVPPESFESLLKLSSNIMVVATFDSDSRSSKILQSWYSEESMERVNNGEDIYKYVRKDEFARDQYSLYLFGKDSDQLINNIRIHCNELTEFFNQRERKRITREIFSGAEQTGLSQALKEKYGIEVRIPFGYDIAKEEKNFIWVSQLGNDLFRNLFFSWKPYRSEDQFNADSIIQWRDQLGSKYLFGSGEEDTSSYMITDQRYMQVQSKTVSFNGQYSIELRGLWRLKNFLRGGPFLTYVFTDKKRQRIYYIEAFLYAPNKMKRGMMRELESTLFTFKP